MNKDRQSDWKRSQIRMPQEQYQDVLNYADENKLSLNSAIIELIDKGLKPPLTIAVPSTQETDLKKEVKNLSEQLDEMMNITTNMYKAYYFAVESNPNIPYEQKQQLTEPKNLDLSKKAP